MKLRLTLTAVQGLLLALFLASVAAGGFLISAVVGFFCLGGGSLILALLIAISVNDSTPG